jgi:chromosome segregation ATPase
VADIIKDAVHRQQELAARVGHLKGEIQALEKEIDQRIQEITRLEAAHAETTKVRDYLENENIDLVADDSRPTTVA